MKTSARYEELRFRAGAVLERTLGRLGSRLVGYALAGVDLVHLYRAALKDERVSVRQRGELLGALLYIVSPVDLVPEALFGPLGLVDDALVATRLLDLLLNRLPEEVVLEHWPGERRVLEQLQAAAAGGRKLFACGLGLGLRRLSRLALRRSVGLLRALPPPPRQRAASEAGAGAP